MKNILALVSMTALLTACAGLGKPGPASAPSPAGSASTDTSASASAPTAETAAAADEKPAVKLPDVPLTSSMLLNILTAEIAAQRGDWETAYSALMTAAEQTRDPRLASRAVELSLAAKKPEQALAAVQLWRNIAPESEEAAQYYLSFAILTNDLAGAEPVLAQRLRDAKEPARGALMLQTQRLLARARDKAASFKVLESLVSPYLSSPEAHLALAQAAFSNGDGDRAKREALLALERKPDSALAALTLAQVSTDRKEAIQALQRFAAANPKARDVRIAYARLLTEDKQYEQARAEFAAMLKENAKDLTSLFALGVIETQTGDLKSAERYLTTYIDVLSTSGDQERDPTQALLLLSQLAEDRKDLPAATAWLDRIEPGEAYLGAQIKRAELIAKGGDVKGARAALGRLDASGPREQTQVAMAESRILREAGLNQQAYEVMDAAASRFPEDNDVLYEFALIAEKVRKFDEMETVLRKIIRTAPNNHHAYNALGYSLAERNIRLQESLELITKALELAPEDPFIMDSMGWVQFRLGKLKEAEEYLRRAYAIRPDPEIGVHLGEVLWVKGEKEVAQQFWRDAKAKEPNNDALNNTLNRLHVRL